MQSPATHLDADDPRRVWEERNRKALRDREQSEAAKKVEVLSKAKEYLEKIYKVTSVETVWFILKPHKPTPECLPCEIQELLEQCLLA